MLEKPAEIADAPGTLLEIPVTIRPAPLSWLPFVGRHFEPRWLRPTKGSVDQIVAVAEDEIAAASGRPIILNCMFHNVEIMPGLSPYAQSEAEADAILGRLEGLLAFAARRGIATIGLGDVPGLIC